VNPPIQPALSIVDQLINQSINPSINPSINRPIRRSIHQVELFNISAIYRLTEAEPYCKFVHQLVFVECLCAFGLESDARAWRERMDALTAIYNQKIREVVGEFMQERNDVRIRGGGWGEGDGDWVFADLCPSILYPPHPHQSDVRHRPAPLHAWDEYLGLVDGHGLEPRLLPSIREIARADCGGWMDGWIDACMPNGGGCGLTYIYTTRTHVRTNDNRRPCGTRC